MTWRGRLPRRFLGGMAWKEAVGAVEIEAEVGDGEGDVEAVEEAGEKHMLELPEATLPLLEVLLMLSCLN